MERETLPAGAGPLPIFEDGFGSRSLTFDQETGDPVELLSFTPRLIEAPGFAEALGERVARLARNRHTSYARVRRIDRPSENALQLVSDRVSGWRLSQVLQVMHREGIPLDISAIIGLMRQLIPAAALFSRQQRDAANGAIGPERLILTPQGRLVIADYVLGPAIEKLQLTRERLWRDYRVVLPPAALGTKLPPSADVTAMGTVALSLVLGRPLKEDEFLVSLGDLLEFANENHAGTKKPLSAGLRDWLARALQFEQKTALESPQDAQVAFEEMLAKERAYVTSAAPLEAFIAAFQKVAGPPAEPQKPQAVAPPPPAPEPQIEVPRPAPATTPKPEIGGRQRPDSDERHLSPAASLFSRPEPPPTPAYGEVARPESRYGEPARQEPRYGEPTAPGPRTVSRIDQPAFGQDEPVAVPEPVAPVAPAPPPPAAEPAAPAVAPVAPVAVAPVAPPAATSAEPPASGGVSKTIVMALAAIALIEAGVIGWMMMGGGPAVSGDRGELVVVSRPSAARVMIDGEERGMTPYNIQLAPGAYTVEIRAGRSEPRVYPVQIVGGVKTDLYFELQSVATVGALDVRSDPAKARVTIDGQFRGTTPVIVRDLPPGDHQVEIDANGRKVRQTVRIEPGVTSQLVVPMGSQ